jgi:heterotetrameric sarcosine oxidase gamma subunit
VAEAGTRLEGAGLRVRLEPHAPAAALRYFSHVGAFGDAVRTAAAALPETGKAVAAGRGLILAWRSPSETLCLARTAERLQEVQAAVSASADGSFIELTGGISLVRIEGARIEELLCRLGGSASMPQPGDARRSRMADVPVLALSVEAGEVQLVLDRTYAEHLLGWIRETLLDLE